MIKRSSRYYLLEGALVLMIGATILLGYAIASSVRMNNKPVSDEKLTYVSYEVLTDNVMPVSKEETSTLKASDIVKPYTDNTVQVGKSYYDYKGKEESQENSIIYYENTYIQNSGVDYTSKNVFDVNAIADGKVISVTQDDIVGTTIKIEHDNELISVYQSVKDAKVKEKDEVKKGQIIGQSGTNSIGSDLGNHLHFELYNKNVLVNPEEFFTNNAGN